MTIQWKKINDTLIESDCGNYRVKKLDRGHITIYAAEIRISELCFLATWYRNSSSDAKQACIDDKVNRAKQC